MLRGFSSSGRASASQAEGGEFEPRNPLHSKTPAKRLGFQLGAKAALLRQAAYEQGLWPRSPRTAAFGGRFALHMPRHWPCGGVCALRAALSARLPAREASHRSDTRLRAQSPPLFGGIRRVACTLLRKDAWLCHRQLFPRTLLLLLCLFRQSDFFHITL